MKVTREKWPQGETCFGGGSGAIIAFRPKVTISSTESLPEDPILETFRDGIPASRLDEDDK